MSEHRNIPVRGPYLCVREILEHTTAIPPTGPACHMCAWKVGTHRTLRLGLFLLVAPSNASPSNDAGCADPISTRHPSPLRPVTTPMTLSWDAGTYLKEDAWYHNLDGIARLTLRELPSTHHLLLFAEWFSVPARLATTGDARGADRCRRPGPNLRLTCCAGTCSPGRTTDAMTVDQQRKRINIDHNNGHSSDTRIPRAVSFIVRGESSLCCIVCNLNSRNDLEDLLNDPAYFQSIFHSLTCVKQLHQSQTELGMANEAIARTPIPSRPLVPS